MKYNSSHSCKIVQCSFLYLWLCDWVSRPTVTWPSLTLGCMTCRKVQLIKWRQNKVLFAKYWQVFWRPCSKIFEWIFIPFYQPVASYTKCQTIVPKACSKNGKWQSATDSWRSPVSPRWRVCRDMNLICIRNVRFVATFYANTCSNVILIFCTKWMEAVTFGVEDGGAVFSSRECFIHS